MGFRRQFPWERRLAHSCITDTGWMKGGNAVSSRDVKGVNLECIRLTWHYSTVHTVTVQYKPLLSPGGLFAVVRGGDHVNVEVLCGSSLQHCSAGFTCSMSTMHQHAFSVCVLCILLLLNAERGPLGNRSRMGQRCIAAPFISLCR